MLLVIEHDNNICGTRGFSDDIVNGEEEARNIVNEMLEKDIIVYDWYITNI